MLAIYPYDQIVKRLSKTLETRYCKEETKKLLYQNGKTYLKQLKEGLHENRTYQKVWKKSI